MKIVKTNFCVSVPRDIDCIPFIIFDLDSHAIEPPHVKLHQLELSFELTVKINSFDGLIKLTHPLDLTKQELSVCRISLTFQLTSHQFIVKYIHQNKAVNKMLVLIKSQLCKCYVQAILCVCNLYVM